MLQNDINEVRTPQIGYGLAVENSDNETGNNFRKHELFRWNFSFERLKLL